MQVTEKGFKTKIKLWKISWRTNFENKQRSYPTSINKNKSTRSLRIQPNKINQHFLNKTTTRIKWEQKYENCNKFRNIRISFQ